MKQNFRKSAQAGSIKKPSFPRVKVFYDQIYSRIFVTSEMLFQVPLNFDMSRDKINIRKTLHILFMHSLLFISTFCIILPNEIKHIISQIVLILHFIIFLGGNRIFVQNQVKQSCISAGLFRPFEKSAFSSKMNNRRVFNN